MNQKASIDSELVEASIAGNRDAFAQIVTRYQSLICSLAYCATGSLTQSEDLAQETFITAWKHMSALREPSKLRSWLCGIARNVINAAIRRQLREPSHKAESLEEISTSVAPGALPSEQSITNEEQAILWRSLEKIPDLYREPLVLFYREHQSIETVAISLELTEDAVKQRLSRGRKLLNEQVTRFIEGALEKTSPGKTFTLSVLATLPIAVNSAKAVSVGTALATGGAAAKSAISIGIIGGIFISLGSLYYSLRGQMDESKSNREKRFVLMMTGLRIVCGLGCVGVYFLIRHYNLFQSLWNSSRLVKDAVMAALYFGICCVAVFFSEFTTERRQKIQVEDGSFVGEEWTVARKVGGNADTSNTSYFRSARFKAMALAVVAMTMMMKMWTWGSLEVIGLLVIWGLMLYLDYGRWQNNPRFSYQGRDMALRMSLTFGFFTFAALAIELWSHCKNASRMSAAILTPGVMTLSFGIVGAYGLLGWFILRRRKRSLALLTEWK